MPPPEKIAVKYVFQSFCNRQLIVNSAELIFIK